jgi:hypothetical protein
VIVLERHLRLLDGKYLVSWHVLSVRVILLLWCCHFPFVEVFTLSVPCVVEALRVAVQACWECLSGSLCGYGVFLLCEYFDLVMSYLFCLVF